MTVNLFHDNFEKLFQAFPAVICSLVIGLIIFNLLVMSVFAIIVAKAMMIGLPDLFLNLNHERAVKIVTLSLVTIECLDILYSLIHCGNKCNTSALPFVLTKYDLHVDHKLDNCHHLPVPLICIVIGTVIEIGIQIVCLQQNRKLKKQINVYTRNTTEKRRHINKVTPQNNFLEESMELNEVASTSRASTRQCGHGDSNYQVGIDWIIGLAEYTNFEKIVYEQTLNSISSQPDT